ncbi:MAG: thymidylate synthase [bacterium]
MTIFDKVYQNLLKDILDNGIEDVNARSQYTCKAIPGAHFNLDLQKSGFPLLTLRKLPLKIFVAEQIWFLMGNNDPAWLRPFTKIWDSFIEEDGKVTSYGYRWRKHFGRDQLGELIKHLKEKPTSRHGVVIAWDPTSDGLTGKPRKNVPCLFAFTVNIIGNKVCLHNVVRSQDVFLGMPHDVPGFALLQMIIAQELGLEPGTYSHSISNAHFYADQYDAARELLTRKNNHQEIKLVLPENSFKRAEAGDTKLVEEIVAQIKAQYHPLEAIKGVRPH